jgi:hypothetical protein
MFCTQCGNPLGYDDKFCSKCGTKVLASTEPPVPNFEDKTPRGSGTVTWTDKNGNKFVGESDDSRWEEGKPYGNFSCLYTNGDVYVGRYLAGERKGIGIITLSDGSIFEGEWDLNDWYKGKLTEPNGSIFIGVWNQKKLFGRELLPNGNQYFVNNGRRERIGKPHNFDGPDYLPNDNEKIVLNTFKKRMLFLINNPDNSLIFPQSKGKINSENKENIDGVIYKGQRKDGEFHGNGYLTFKTPHLKAGEEYKGQFKNGKKHGNGTITYTNGRTEYGKWENDILLAPDKEINKKYTAKDNTKPISTNDYEVQLEPKKKDINNSKDIHKRDTIKSTDEPNTSSDDSDLILGLITNYLSMGVQFNVKKSIFGKYKLSKRQLIYIGAFMFQISDVFKTDGAVKSEQVPAGKEVSDQILQLVFGPDQWRDISRKSNHAWLSETSNITVETMMNNSNLQLVTKAKEDLELIYNEGDIPDFPPY